MSRETHALKYSARGAILRMNIAERHCDVHVAAKDAAHVATEMAIEPSLRVLHRTQHCGVTLRAALNVLLRKASAAVAS